MAMPAVFSCDTSTGMDPYVIIDVYTGAFPVDATHKLKIFLYVDSTWDLYYLTASYTTNVIYMPPLNTGDYPIYFEITYDADGDNTENAGDWYYGWHEKITNRDVEILDPLIRPDMEFMYISIDMEANHGTFL
ncbi:MAG: hypothetical protein JW807_00100 [Spirochaetes bacterium]|nr:hypothetical protein [Spirochaetota bacterium]